MRKSDIKSVTGRRKKGKIILFVFLAAAVAVAVSVNHSLKPLIKTLAISRAETIATASINNAVMGIMENENITYSDLVNISYNADGLVTSVKIDSIKANRLKAKLSSAIVESLDNTDRKQISIPLGTVTGIDFLAGRGPKIKLYINLSGGATTDIVSEFSTAGINQVCHRIDLEVTANIYIIMAGQNASAEIKSDINLAETVIVGLIPDIYAGTDDQIWPNLID